LNANTFGALFRDALYQVLDNKVFRVLAVTVCGLVVATFLVGAREESIVLLFGVQELRYEDVFSFFGMPYPGMEGAGEILVQSVQTIFVDWLAGSVGILFAVAATAFFVPRMLEKGAADTLFSKPVSRLTLLLSRYAAGLIFVALLAVVLVGGMHVGFLVSSGYSDPGFLWSIVTLVYVFGLLHGVSVLIGVLTRSTVASILLTVVFMLFNGCVHGGWMAKDYFVADEANRQRAEEEDRQEEEAEESATPAIADGSQEDPAMSSIRDEEDSVWKTVLFTTLDTIHYVLPKTSDADMIARKMRRDLSLRYSELWDPEGGLLVPAPPKGWERRAGVEAIEGDGALWSLPDGSATMRLQRRPIDKTSRMRAAKALRQELETRADVRDVEDERSSIANVTSSRVNWVEGRAESERAHRVHFFASGDQLYSMEIEGTPAWRADKAADEVVQDFHRGMTFNESTYGTDPGSRYENLLGWDAPLRYNIFFSIGSSLAFLLAVLGVAWWRLSRIDF
jgi:ABC-type transport system involved in multi-copper enzyme maturation permease subunit